MGKGIVVLLLLAFAVPALGQTTAGQGRGQPRVGPAPKAHYNSTAKDTTPFHCIVRIGSQAMREIPNGWDQVWGEAGWQRCRGG